MALNVLLSSCIAALWGVSEHFGKSPSCLLITGNFDVSCWVQVVQLRVFATFGQPNWMAAWMAAVIPLTWIPIFEKKNLKIHIVSLSVFAILFASLLFTKSKSGIASFGVSAIIFVLFTVFLRFKELKYKFSKLLLLPLVLVITIFLFGSPWTPSVFELSQKKVETPSLQETGTALESGGTDSGIIRKIVWKGAINVWGKFPIFGSGVETFAFSYYSGRPMEHNLVSEWNFLYNKAHNEYLNYLATTGIVGLSAYMLLILVSMFHLFKLIRLQKNSHEFYLQLALFVGYISILITNFFGFSVVPVSLLFYLFPAVVIVSVSSETGVESKNKRPEGMQLVSISTVLIVGMYLLFSLINYWRADYIYARALEAQNGGDYSASLSLYRSAISLSPNESMYHAQLGATLAELTTAKEADSTLLDTFTNASKLELTTAIEFSPANVRILKSVANSYATLGDHDSAYLLKTLEITQMLQVLAPTDPSVLYQQCLTIAKLGRIPDSLLICEKAVEMKPNYKIARQLLAFLYTQTKQPAKAKAQLEYILKYISPDDTSIQKQLNSL